MDKLHLQRDRSILYCCWIIVAIEIEGAMHSLASNHYLCVSIQWLLRTQTQNFAPCACFATLTACIEEKTLSRYAVLVRINGRGCTVPDYRRVLSKHLVVVGKIRVLTHILVVFVVILQEVICRKNVRIFRVQIKLQPVNSVCCQSIYFLTFSKLKPPRLYRIALLLPFRCMRLDSDQLFAAGLWHGVMTF